MTSNPSLLTPRLRLLSLAASLAACGGQRLSVGDNDADGAATSDLCNGGTLTGNVVARHQDQLDALLGCEVIEGDLRILRSDPAEQLSLAPLSGLRLVGGDFRLERLASLAGLEALEQVGRLRLSELDVSDLAGLSGLERIGGGSLDGGEGGAIEIQDNPQLQSLSGLDQLLEWTHLALADNAALETLEGLSGPPTLGEIELSNLPALHDLSGLDFVHEVARLSITNTGMVELDGIEFLARAQSLTLERNAALVSLRGLGRLSSVDYLQLKDNDSLLYPGLPGLEGARAISITQNDEIGFVPSYSSRGDTGLYFGAEGSSADLLVVSRELFEVGDNANLQTILGPDGFRDVQQVSIWGNPRLTSVNLKHLQRANGLQIRDNIVLSSLSVVKLERVGDLEIVNNPALSTADLANIPTFSRTMSGNGDTPPVPAP